jgi:crotonobetainyl-CoA:carnitine CoA-transferase CaiB-like acyl-CoA transferase
MTPGKTGRGILDGIRVLDFTAVIAGPYATRLMADLGAEVLKVEPPEGELLRHGPPFRDGVSALFSQLNSGKRCISLDLKKPAAREVILALLPGIDVVVENFSPGVMARLGLDYETLRTHKPDLVMCAISGYGQTGPAADRPAFAPIVQAWSGYETVTLGYQPGLTKPLNMGLPVADTTAALQAHGAVMAALFHHARTGEGQFIDIAMHDALLATMHKDFQQMLNPDGRERLYGPVATCDGFVLVILLSQRHFEALADAMEQPALKRDSRFSKTAERMYWYADLMTLVGEWVAGQTTAEVVGRLEAAGVPVSPYRDLRAALTDPQLHHRDMITELVDAAGPLPVPNTPMQFSATEAAIKPWVATLGQHTDEVLKDLGYSDEAIATLRSEAVIR